jgi:2-methylcitrate dehydratase PrpD
MTPEGHDIWLSDLAQRVSGLSTGEIALEPEIRQRSALVLVDDLAAMIAGSGAEQVARLDENQRERSAGGEARTVLGSKLARANAALVNATAADWDELDEGYRPATCHGGLYALPAAMAEAESSGADIAQVLRAVVVGYEVSTAHARLYRPTASLVLHPHAVFSSLGAASAVASLRKCESTSFQQVIQVAATMTLAGPYQHALDGHEVRNAWAGAGAMLGFVAADLASAGILGSTDSAYESLHGGLGYQVSEDELLYGIQGWAIEHGYHKAYPCCQYAHSSVEATLSIVDRDLIGQRPEDIEEILVEVHPLGFALANRSPQTSLGGKFSVPHAVATVIAHRNAGLPAFARDALFDERVDSLRQRIRLLPFDGDLHPPHDRPARVTVRMNDGTEFTEECLSAIGGPDRPLGVDQVLEKVERVTHEIAPGFAAVARSLVEDSGNDSEQWSSFFDVAVAR